jgi:alpha-mannosidase
MGFASNGLYNFDLKNGALRATLARASRWTDDLTLAADDMPWVASVDSGELRFKFLLAPGDEKLPLRVRLLEEPITCLAVPPSPGNLPRSGSLAEMQPASLRILSLRETGDGTYSVMAQDSNGQPSEPRIMWRGRWLKLGQLPAGKIGVWRLIRQDGEWVVGPDGK